jgi:hypothetical protein
MEYIRICFSISRAVIINGKTSGKTNTALQVAAGQHHVTLDGNSDFAPSKGVRIRVRPGETNVISPKDVKFSEGSDQSVLFSFSEGSADGAADKHAPRTPRKRPGSAKKDSTKPSNAASTPSSKEEKEPAAKPIPSAKKAAPKKQAKVPGKTEDKKKATSPPTQKSPRKSAV